MTLKKIAEWDLNENQVAVCFTDNPISPSWVPETVPKGLGLVCRDANQAADLAQRLTHTKVFPALISDDHPVELSSKEIETTKALIEWLWEGYLRETVHSEDGDATQEEVNQYKQVMESLNKG